jgi:phosphoribosylanthranilate isomerase
MEVFAPDYIQFHGDESPEHIVQCAAKYGVGVIKACPVSMDSDMKSAERYAAADFILYDAKPPAGSDVRGGHGVAIDWDIIARAPLPKVWALAGGLTPDTVSAALSATRAPILDVSSGVERAPGVKEVSLIQAFMKAVSHGRS